MPFIMSSRPTDNSRFAEPTTSGYGYGGPSAAAFGSQGGNQSKYSGQVPGGGSMPNFQVNPFMGGAAGRVPPQAMPPQPQATPPIYAGAAGRSYNPANPFMGASGNAQAVQARWGGMAHPLGMGHQKGSGAGANFVFGQDNSIPAGGWGSLSPTTNTGDAIGNGGASAPLGTDTGSALWQKPGIGAWQDKMNWLRGTAGRPGSRNAAGAGGNPTGNTGSGL